MFRIFSTSIFIFLFFGTPSQAATIYIDPATTTINRGDAITTAIRLMPDKESGECINVVDAVISYTDNIQPVDVSIGKSIFNVWVEQPIINKENHTITFAGGIPNGYCGRVEGDPMLTNIIAEIIFRSPGMQVGNSDAGDQAVIQFLPETQALLNDGQGTRAPLATYGSTINLNKTPGALLTDEWRQNVKDDFTLPEEFTIELVKDDEGINYNGKYYIVFTTTDKQTGISHYEVMEESISKFGSFDWGGVGSSWIPTDKGIYTLKDQSLNSIIRVKAIDKAGNEYIATLIPDESQKTISTNQIISYIAIGVLALLFLIIIIVIRLRIKRRKLIQNNDGVNFNSNENNN